MRRGGAPIIDLRGSLPLSSSLQTDCHGEQSGGEEGGGGRGIAVIKHMLWYGCFVSVCAHV